MYMYCTFCYMYDSVVLPLSNRAPRQTNKLDYSYQLCGLTSDPTMGNAFQPMASSFHHMRVEDYNWNYLDQHVCGHSDFEELGEASSLFPSLSPSFSSLFPHSLPLLPLLLYTSQYLDLSFFSHTVSEVLSLSLSPSPSRLSQVRWQ